MKFCEECGAKLEDDALFCEECGTKVENDELDTNDGFETIGEDFKFCEECGAKNEISAMFCEECGAKFEFETAIIEPEPEVESQIEEPESESIVVEPEPEVIIEATEPEPAVEPEAESQIEEPESEPIVEELEPEATIEAIEPEPELEPEVEPQIEEPESESIVVEPEPEVIIEAAEPEPELEPELEPEAEPQIEEAESEPIVVEPEPEVIIEAVELEPELEPEAEPQIEEPEPELIVEEPEPEAAIEAVEPEPEAEPQPKSVKNTEQIVKIDSKPKKKGVFVTILLVLCGILVGTVVEYFVFWRGRNAGDNSAIPTNMPSNMSSEENTQSELTVLDTIKLSEVPELTAVITLKPTATSEPVNTSIPATTSEPTATSKPASTATPKPTSIPTSTPTTAVVKTCNGKHGDIIVKSKLDSEYADYYKVMIGCVDCDELNNVIYVQKGDWNGKWYYFTNSGELKSENIEANHNSVGFIVRYTSGVSRFATCKATGEAVEYIEIIYNGDYGDLNSHRTFIADYVEMPLIHDYRCSGFFFVEGTNREKIYVVLTCNDCEKRVEGLMTYNPPKTYADYVIYGDSLTPRINLEYPCIALRCTDGDISVVYETGKYALWLYGAEAKDIPEIKAPDLSKENVPVTAIPVPSLKVAEENKLLNGAVDTSSAYDYSFSAQFDARGKNQFPGSRFVDRTPVYFYHPIKFVFDDENVKPAIWVSSDNKVARVYSDGVVEAFSEGFADISAYDAKGHLIGTVKIFTTTKADADPIGSYIDYSDRNAIIRAYKDIPFQDIQESINNITDLVAYMYAHEVSYVMEQEGTSPSQQRSSYGDDWTQTIGSDWLFKNEAGICHNASAAALYSLVGDYERNGIIQMSGDYGHTISWFYENGKYYVYDFTGVYDRVSEINHKYRNNIYAFVMDNIGIGDTLYDALTDCMENSGADFYFKNFVLYSVELTGKDYYPAESNSWLHNSRDIYEKVNKVYFTKGTNVELLYLQDGIKLEMVFIDRDDAGQSMRAYVPPTDTEAITMDTNYGRLRSITLMTLDSYNPGRTKSSINDIKLPTGVGFNDTYAKGDLRASAITLSYKENGFVSWLANLTDLSDCIVVDFDGTYQFELPEGKKVDYYVSSDSNVLRVRSDGVLKAYGEGLANVWACDKNGNVVANHSYTVTTAADLGPLMKTRKGYKDINLEDIPGQLKTITDYACWLYENNVVFDESREPKSPKPVIQDATNRAIWFPIANSEWVFMDKTGVCCNFSAGASYALCNDYEMTGQIMMCGPYGHVINYYYENGQYYVIDYTKVVEDYDLITVLYHGNAALYVSERIGIGNSVKEAYKDYTSKNDRWFYEENYIMYTVNTSGYNFYNTECNNWSSNGVSKNKVNTLYSSTCDLNELFYKKDGYEFSIEPLHKEEVPSCIQTFYSKSEAPSWQYTSYFKFCDNTSNLSGTLDGGNANSGGAAVNSNGGMDGSGLEMTIEEAVTGTLVYDGMWFGCYDNKYLSFWGMAGDGIILPERLIIPEEINDLPVKIIGEWSITKTEKLKEIYFPRSIERVGNMNFYFGDYRKFVAYVYEGSFMEEYCKKYNFNYVLR